MGYIATGASLFDLLSQANPAAVATAKASPLVTPPPLPADNRKLLTYGAIALGGIALYALFREKGPRRNPRENGVPWKYGYKLARKPTKAEAKRRLRFSLRSLRAGTYRQGTGRYRMTERQRLAAIIDRAIRAGLDPDYVDEQVDGLYYGD